MTGYFGSKAASGLFQNIISIMPPHNTFIETHLGGGAVMKRKPPTENNIGIDLDPDAISAFDCEYPVQLIHDCAHRFLADYSYTGSELIYCDPPYLKSTRTSSREYRFDYTVQDHIRLLKLLKSLPCHIILSGYPSSLYEAQLGNWNRIELQAMTHGGPRTEILWYNYTINRTHWATFAGKDFTDRQRIKRKAERWGNNYKRLPHAERLAIMATLMDAESAMTQS